MAKKQRPNENGARLHAAAVLDERLREQNNPIDWLQLHKALHYTMTDLNHDLGKWFKQEQLFEFAMDHLNRQIRTDYKHGLPRGRWLLKRMGWKRTKTKNVV